MKRYFLNKEFDLFKLETPSTPKSPINADFSQNTSSCFSGFLFTSQIKISLNLLILIQKSDKSINIEFQFSNTSSLCLLMEIN